MTIARPWTLWGPGSSDPDGPLLARARQGSESAFDQLRRRHDVALRGFVSRRVGADAAEDLAQEIWLACWQALPKYAGRSRFKSWLYGIAVHKCASHVRGRVQEARREESLLLAEAPAPDAYRALELQDAVRDALDRLPDAQREVLALYYYAELTLAEIGQALDRNLNTVKYQFYRAHAQVEQALKSESGTQT